MAAAKEYDAIVIGAGQAGGPIATALGKIGRKTAIIERGDVGGSCINYGCTPTKTMVASARVAYLARRGGDYGVQTGKVRVDMGSVRQRKRDIVESFRSRVTIIERGPRLLSHEDADVAEEVARILREDGIDFLLETRVVRVGEVRGKVRLTLQEIGKSHKRTLSGSHLLAAVGRAPSTDTLRPEMSELKAD